MDALVYISGVVPDLAAYAFTAVSGSATLTGYYVDRNGIQVGAAVSYTITTATTLTSLASGGVLPVGAEGFTGILAGTDLYRGFGGLSSGSIQAGMTPAAGYPLVVTGPVSFGRINGDAANSSNGGAAAGGGAGGGITGVTPVNQSNITLTTAALIMAANPERQYAELQNNNTSGGASIWCSWTTTTPTVGGSGCFQLFAGGGGWTPPGGVVPTSALYAVSASGSSILYAVQG